MDKLIGIDRRNFVRGAVATSIAAIVSGDTVLSAAARTGRYRICAFEKFLQELSYDELADVISELGFDGIEATVRKKGHVLPERVEEDLPKLVEALKRRDVEVTTMATDVVNPDQPLTEKVLRTAKALGISSYRMGYYRYDLKKSILPQWDTVRPQINELAALNGEIGITGLYQNHSGAKYVGAGIWDMFQLLGDIPPKQIGLAFDIRHATVEAGNSWPVIFDVVKPRIGALFVKDFKWDGRKSQHVPLGTGLVDPRFFDMVKDEKLDVPISLHVEYLGEAGTQANIDALRRDFKVLRELLG